MQWRCSCCLKTLDDVHAKTISCACKLVTYCSRRCNGIDGKRHSQWCKDSNIVYKVRIGCATLFRITCGIYENPCQAYAYSLLHRLECPREFVKEIYYDYHDSDKKWLWNIFKYLHYDVDSFVDAIGDMLSKSYKKKNKKTSTYWCPMPEVMGVIQLKECTILEKLVGKVSEENTCLFLMVTTQDESSLFAVKTLSVIDELYEMYNGKARQPLKDLFYTLQEDLS